MAQLQKSSYGKSNGGMRTGSTSGARSGSSAAVEKKESKTTHYAYTLVRDGEGNVTGKDFVNNIQLYLNEGKFSPILKMRVTGPVPQDDIYIVEKRAKTDAE